MFFSHRKESLSCEFFKRTKPKSADWKSLFDNFSHNRLSGTQETALFKLQNLSIVFKDVRALSGVNLVLKKVISLSDWRSGGKNDFTKFTKRRLTTNLRKLLKNNFGKGTYLFQEFSKSSSYRGLDSKSKY